MAPGNLRIRLQNLIGRCEPTRIICMSCDEPVSEWITIRWQLTDKNHWPSVDGKEYAQLCLPCAIPIINAEIHQVLTRPS